MSLLKSEREGGRNCIASANTSSNSLSWLLHSHVELAKWCYIVLMHFDLLVAFLNYTVGFLEESHLIDIDWILLVTSSVTTNNGSVCAFATLKLYQIIRLLPKNGIPICQMLAERTLNCARNDFCDERSTLPKVQEVLRILHIILREVLFLKFLKHSSHSMTFLEYKSSMIFQ